MKNTAIIFKYFFLFLILSSCNDGLKTRLAEIEKKETELNEREKNFALKQADYEKLQKMRDSIFSKKDTLQITKLPDSLAGKWQNRMVCTESNCIDHAIGDQRVESWEIAETENAVVAKVFNKGTFVRLYTGNFDGSTLKLSFKSDGDAENSITMNVFLNDFSGNKIRGNRVIIGSNNCVSKYSVELERK